MDALAKGEESDLLEDAFTRRKIGRLPDPVKVRLSRGDMRQSWRLCHKLLS